MRINEVSGADDNQRLSALIQFLIGRSQDSDSPKKISTTAFLQLAQNMGIPMTQPKLLQVSQQPPLSVLIDTVTPEEIMFRGSEPEASSDNNMTVDQARKTVDSMAKRAAKKGL